MRKSILALSIIAMTVSACAGSSTSGGVLFEASPIRVFADASGVGQLRIETSDEQGTGYILSPEIALVLEDLEETETISPADISGLSATGTGPNTVIRQGAISEDGVALNVLEVSTVDGDAAAVLLEEPLSGDSILLTAGDLVPNMPVSGTASYAGVIGMQNLVFDPVPELGTFTATVNFGDASPRVVFEGGTNNYSVIGSARVSGTRFAATDITIFDAFEAQPVAGSLNGDFHGGGANSMAGVIFSNDNDGNYRGSFVGSQ